MVLLKEYRICMPLSVEEYRIGQLYMIARHSLEQTESGNGVEIVENKECEDPQHGKGQFTEKRIHLNGRLPYWLQAVLPNVFYITEKAWNYYPFTITEYTCSFLPKFSITIQTTYEDNSGTTDNALNLSVEVLKTRTVDHVDIVYDEISAKHYKEEEDLKFFKSKKTGRGPLAEDWRNTVSPVMCSYKVVEANFEVWGLQARAEELIHSCIREILLIGHKQAFAWIDSWIDMTMEDVRKYEKSAHEQTNDKLGPTEPEAPLTPGSKFGTPSATPPATPSTPAAAVKSWFGW
ncbi:unnamed protein product [Nesidiocoris tenuis]|uniref:Cytoplasmic phosphatidylinositol transfer protein 1 n=2 Tax=Nesidiocoris tenuis TaxID=355587 RepID=A0A6H5H4Q4_9HEMI|nr:Phosphatidylinositol transfer protein [Nesidiocoris tenuis]CAB0010587.1 unnamed protein product [Nesidiocoris tenuis]